MALNHSGVLTYPFLNIILVVIKVYPGFLGHKSDYDEGAK
jgi:hypothetical protein